MLADVFIDRSLPQINQLFTYRVAEKMYNEINVGQRVIVPFGRGSSKATAIVIRLRNQDDENRKLKEIYEVVDRSPVLSKKAIDLGIFMRERYLVDYAQAFRPLLPGKAIGEIEEKYSLNKEIKNNPFFNMFQEKEFIWASDLTKEEKDRMVLGIKNKEVLVEFSLKGIVEKRETKYFALAEKSKPPLSSKQEQVWTLLSQKGPLSKKEIMDTLSISSSPINSLIQKGFLNELSEKDLSVDQLQKGPGLNSEQKKAFEDILGSDELFHLLFGVTGSGKTEVYLELVDYYIKAGFSAIVLVPEISLTVQVVSRFEKRFGSNISVLHSKLSQGEKSSEWLRIKEGKCKIVIGARSAIFAPLSNLGLVIVDEEQEESYRYHDSLRYDTIEVAKELCRISRAKLLLGSATPSIETFYEAIEKNEISIHRLKNRANILAKKPEIKIADMREELEKGNTSIFSGDLLQEIGNTLSRKEQTILFINRRGFSNFVSCRNCGYVIKCNNCDISMTYHKSIHSLTCHYCGGSKPMPLVCPECGSKYIKQFGVGTEQVEEEARKYFPQARIFRMDKDTMQKKNSYSDLYRSMSQGEIDILIGTQMLAKGFDFNRLSLVGIIAADTSLNIPDFRAHERTFQLLTQVSGRAGRAAIPGKAIIQTYTPENYAIDLAQEDDYEKFYQQEIVIRKSFFYPPYSKIIRLRVSSPREERASEAATKWWNTFKIISEKLEIRLELLGPYSQPRIKNMYNFEVGIKTAPETYHLLLQESRRVIYNYYRKINEKDIKLSIEID